MTQNIKQYSLMFVFYILLGIVFTWPLAPNITTRIPNNLSIEARHTKPWGDHLQIVAGIKELRANIENIVKQMPVYDKEFCLHEIEECQLSTFYKLKKILFSPYWQPTILYFATDDIELAYNLSILNSFVLTGIATYLLSKSFITSKRISKYHSELLALTASLFAALAPLRLHQELVGHKAGSLLWILIILMYLVEKNIAAKKIDIRIPAIQTLLLIFLAVNEQFLMLLAFGYIIARIVWVELFDRKFLCLKTRITMLITLKKYLWIIPAYGASAAINLAGKLESISNSHTNSGRSLEEISLYSPQISDLLYMFNTEHELNLYLGAGLIVIIAGLAYAIYKTLTGSENRTVDKLIFFLICCYIILFISLGTNTPLYKLFYDYVPVFKFGRTPVRYAFILFPLIAVIFTLLGQKLLAQKSNYIKPVFMVITILIVLSFYRFNPISTTVLPDNIASTSMGEKILFAPYTQPDNFFGSIFEYHISQTNSVTLNGYTPFISQAQSAFYDTYASRLNRGELSKTEINELTSRYEIDTIIILKKYFGRNDFDLPDNETAITNIEKVISQFTEAGFEPSKEDEYSVILKPKS